MQNITRDIEIKNTLTVTRGWRERYNRKIGEGWSRNTYKGHVDKAKGGRIEGWKWGWMGSGVVLRGEMETTVLEQQ